MSVKQRIMINVTKTKLPKIEEYIKYLKKIWETNWVTNNSEFLQLLEKKLQDYLKVKNLLLVSNGTLALQLLLKGFDLKGEVITTPFTFSATTNVILWEGLEPVFADIDPQTFNIDPQDVGKKITQKTSAILAVHVYGNCCDVEKLQKIANKHNLKLIYDAAHAFGVEYKNQSILNYGDASALSFHATKTFNTIEGGGIVVKNKELFEKLKLLRNFGIKSEEEVILPGINAKMNEFQAIMGLCNLEEIDREIQLRKKIYERYKAGLSDNKNIKFQEINGSKYNYTYMPICFKDIKERDAIHSELVKNGIKPRKYFFPLTVNFEYFKRKGVDLVEKYGLKIASDIADRILCLPLYSDLKMAVVDRIIKIIEREISVR